MVATSKTSDEKVKVRVKSGKHFYNQYEGEGAKLRFSGKTEVAHPGDVIEVTLQEAEAFAFKFERIAD